MIMPVLQILRHNCKWVLLDPYLIGSLGIQVKHVRTVPLRQAHARQAQLKRNSDVSSSLTESPLPVTSVSQDSVPRPSVLELNPLHVADSRPQSLESHLSPGRLSQVYETSDRPVACLVLESPSPDNKLQSNHQNPLWYCSQTPQPPQLPQPDQVSVTLEGQPPGVTSASRNALIPLQSSRSWAPYLEIAAGLSKARLSGLVVSTAMVGCALAASTSLTSAAFLAHPYQTILCLALGTALTSAAANTVNQIVEIPHDSQMIRTRNRVLVRGLTSPGRAGLFALSCASVGLCVLYLGTNPLVTGLAAGNLLLYTAVYTPLKQMSQANTWIGAWVGAVPPLMGWAAATEQLHSGSLILASLLYVWQFPHFMALSWNLRHEYCKAGYMMTAVLDPDLCKRVALRHAVASSLVCLAGAGCSALSLGPWAGCALGLACLPPNIGLIYYAWQFARAPPGDGSSAAARRLFRATLFHLPVVMTAALVGTYCCAVSGVAA